MAGFIEYHMQKNLQEFSWERCNTELEYGWATRVHNPALAQSALESVVLTSDEDFSFSCSGDTPQQLLRIQPGR